MAYLTTTAEQIIASKSNGGKLPPRIVFAKYVAKYGQDQCYTDITQLGAINGWGIKLTPELLAENLDICSPNFIKEVIELCKGGPYNADQLIDFWEKVI